MASSTSVSVWPMLEAIAVPLRVLVALTLPS
jgi:hypothetical protein